MRMAAQSKGLQLAHKSLPFRTILEIAALDDNLIDGVETRKPAALSQDVEDIVFAGRKVHGESGAAL
jgi:hypothetical protein